jgi:hypothetical protein
MKPPEVIKAEFTRDWLQIEGCPIFGDEEDRKWFVSRVRQLVKKKGTRILAWVLMDKSV